MVSGKSDRWMFFSQSCMRESSLSVNGKASILPFPGQRRTPRCGSGAPNAACRLNRHRMKSMRIAARSRFLRPSSSLLRHTAPVAPRKDAGMIDAEFATPQSDFAAATFGTGKVETSLPPFDHFEQAASAVLARLRADTGLALWAFTRVQGDDCVLLAVDDDNYGLHAGACLSWKDSLCSRMTRGDGPQAAPDVLAEPNYRDAPMLRHAPIRAYIGVPVQHSGGQLFGTLCGFDPAPRGPELARFLPQVRLHARLLGTLLEHDLDLEEARRRAERAEMESLADPLTGAYNRRGWIRLLKAEDARCRRYGQSAGMLTADLDDLKLINDSLGHDAGDALLVRAARALSAV